MRPIKFRAWDKVNQAMCPVWSMAWKAWGGGDALNYVEIKGDGTCQRFGHEVALMQATGLKDCHGKEVYEGDILKLDGGGKTQPSLTVEWNQASAQWAIRAPWLRGHTNQLVPLEAYIDMDFCTVEVIGNIHQHAHLLVQGHVEVTKVEPAR